MQSGFSLSHSYYRALIKGIFSLSCLVFLDMGAWHSHMLLGEGSSTRWEWLILHGGSVQAADRQTEAVFRVAFCVI